MGGPAGHIIRQFTENCLNESGAGSADCREGELDKIKNGYKLRVLKLVWERPETGTRKPAPKEEVIMYLPKIYEKFMKDFPEVFKAYHELGVLTRKGGPLDSKAQDLVKLGIAIGANSRGGVKSHTRKALHDGMTKEEIIHSGLLGVTTIGFPNMIAALGWIEEVLSEKDV